MSCLSQQTAPIVPRVPAFEAMPPYLQERMSQVEKPCCLLWRMKRVKRSDGTFKWTKVPLSAGGRGDKWDDPVDRGTYFRIKSLAASYGVGHGLGTPLGEIAAIEGEFLSGLDVDSCLDPLTGAMAPWAIPAVGMFQTYGEVSPSGSGLKLFFRMTRADAEKAEGLLAEIRARYAGNANVFPQKGAVPTAGEHAPAFEIYIQKRWFALTGDRWGDAKDVELIGYETFEDFILNVAMPFADKPTKEEDRARKKGEKKGVASSEAKGKAKGSSRPSARSGAAGHSTDEKPADWSKRHISDLSREEIVARLGGDDNGQWINSPGPGHSDADRTLGLILDPTDPKGFRINSLVGDDWKLCEELVMRKLGLSPTARPAPKTPEEERAAKEQKAVQEAESEALAAKKRDACTTVWNEGRTDDPRVGTYLDQWRGGLPTPPDVFKTSRSYVGKNGDICRLPDTDAEKVNIIAQVIDFKTRKAVGLHVTVVEPLGDGETVIRNAKNKDGSSTRFTCGSGAGFIDLFAGGLGTRTLFCAEGNETALALLLLPLGFSDPAVRALVSAGNFTKMPPAGDKFDTIVVAADIEKSGTGLKAAREFAKIQRADGVRVLVVIPILPEGEAKRDCNDIILDCRAEGRAPEEGRDYELHIIEPHSAGDDDTAAYMDEHSFADHDLHDGAPDPNTLEGGVAELNKRYFFVTTDKQAWVVEETIEPQFGTFQLKYLKPQAFKDKFDDRKFPDPSDRHKKRKIGLGTYWYSHPKRRKIEGDIVFDPSGKAGPRHYNRWRGFPEAAEGDISKYLWHTEHIICGGDAAFYSYLIKWMAIAVQHPERTGDVALVLQGAKGCGKTMWAEAFVKLFGPHGVTIANSAHFLSDFNALLQDVVMCFADEAYWAGDPKKVGQLQGMITGRRQTTQRKGVDTVASRSFLHLIVGTNDEHAVPASTDERRFAVPTVSARMKGNREYWAALATEIASPHFTGALLHFLQNVDLEGYHPTFDCPVTEGLRDQVAKSLQGLPAWWMDVLARGYAAKSKHACDVNGGAISGRRGGVKPGQLV